MGRPSIDLTGRTFSKLVAIERAAPIGESIAWLCLCECGNYSKVRTGSLTSGATKSCGCLKALSDAKTFSRIHGMHRSPTYLSWQAMKMRCLNPNYEGYHNYGGRGIAIHQEWVGSFAAFLSDMGVRPEGKTLDRKDNEGNYHPDNCKWSTRKEQQNNRRKKYRTRAPVIVESNSSTV